MAKGAHKSDQRASHSREADKKKTLQSGMPTTTRTPNSRRGSPPTDRPTATNVEVSADGQTITIFVPLTFRRIGGRKLVITPTGHDEWAPSKPRIDTPLLNAVVRAFHWKEMLENGEFATVRELAAAEQVNPSYLAQVLHLTQLAPEIVDAILDGRQPPTLQLQSLLRLGFPDEWESQLTVFLPLNQTSPDRAQMSRCAASHQDSPQKEPP